MYTVEYLRNLTIQPKINDISLSLLLEYYETYLLPFVYSYEIDENGKKYDIKLMFTKENFCHLLGVESIARNNVNNADLRNYRGIGGWNNIVSGEVDFRKLKSLNQRKFKDVKAKYVYFYTIPGILDEPLAVKFDNSRLPNNSRIQCKILFYNHQNNAVVHLGIEAGSNGFYFPRTFFVEKLKNTNGRDIYIDNQQRIIATKKNRIIREL